MIRHKVEDELTREHFEDGKPFKDPSETTLTYSCSQYRDLIFVASDFDPSRVFVYAKIKLITDQGILITRSVFNREVEVFIMFHDLKLVDNEQL